MRVIVVDMRHQPATWDIVDRIVAGLMRLGLDGGAHVVFVPGDNDGFKKAERLAAVDRPRRVLSVLLPVCWLFGCTATWALDRASAQRIVELAEASDPAKWKSDSRRIAYDWSEIVAANRGGRAVPSPAAPAWARERVAREFPGLFVTMTLRDMPYAGERNTSEAWIEASARLRARGVRVAIVPDASEPLKQWKGVDDCWPAIAADPALRLALYERAAVNMGTLAGAFWFALYIDRPFRMFCPTSGEAARIHLLRGVPRGEQFPWSTANQQMIWKEQTAENLTAEALGALAGC